MNVKFVEITKTKFNQIATKDEGALYIVKDGTKRELWKGSSFIAGSDEGGAESNYNEVEITTLSSGETIYLSQLVSYKKIKIELYASSITKGTSDIIVANAEFNPEFFTRKEFGVHEWIDTIDPRNYTIDVTNPTITDSYSFIEFLNSNYPPDLSPLNTKARGTDGSLPAKYYYAYVGQNIYYRNLKILLDTGYFSTISGTQARFTAPNNVGVDYKLRVSGVIF